MFNFFKKSRFSVNFFSPKKSDILIYDQRNSNFIIDYILFDKKFTIYQKNPEIIYFGLKIILSFIKNIFHFKKIIHFKSFFSKIIFYYRVNIILYMNPKIVITYIDNLDSYNMLSRYFINNKNISFIAMQCGARLTSRLNPEKIFFHDHFICYGKNEIDLYNKWGHKVENFHPAGSLKCSIVLKNIEPKKVEQKFDICLVSIWRSMMYKESPDFKDNISDLWYSFDKMNEHIKRYIEEYDLRLCIAMNSKMGQSYKPVGVISEEEYFFNIFGDNNNIEMVDYNHKNLSSYFNMIQSDLVISTASTLIIEALALQKKVIYIDYTNNDLHHSVYSDVITHKDNNYKKFKERINNLRNESSIEFHNNNKEYFSYLMNSGVPSYEYVRNLIEKLIS